MAIERGKRLGFLSAILVALVVGFGWGWYSAWWAAADLAREKLDHAPVTQ